MVRAPGPRDGEKSAHPSGNGLSDDWAGDLATGPPSYLLSGPPVRGAEFRQRRPGTVMMVRQHVAANTRDIEERQIADQETSDGSLIGGIQYGSAGAALTGHFMSQFQSREGFRIGLLEVQRLQLAPVHSPGRSRPALRVGQRVFDRQAHLRPR